MFIWVNGAYVPDDQPVISGHDRGFLYGDGLFETLRAYPEPKAGFTEARVFRINEHLERLGHSAQKLKIPLTVSQRSFIQAINRLLKLNNLAEARIRITLSRGKKISPHIKKRCWHAKPTIIIETEPCPDYTKEREEGIKCIIASHRRSAESPLFRHKTLNVLENILAREEAQHQKAFEALFINTENKLAEGSRSNIFIVKKGWVFTPPLSANILPGVTRKIVFGLCTGQGIPVREKSLRVKDFSSADEIFLTGSIIEIMPVVVCQRHPDVTSGRPRRKCADKKIGTGKPGRITQLLQQAYQTLINT